MWYDGIHHCVSILGSGKDGSEEDQSTVPEEISWPKLVYLYAISDN